MKKVPAFRLRLEAIDDEARRLEPFKWADANIGSRHKIGGRPDFIQAVDTPCCDDCAELMSFYGQLDSLNDEYCLADCGLIYIFVCFDCNAVKSFIQSY